MYDALKKAEAERKKAEGIGNNTSENVSPIPTVVISENNKIIMLLIAVIVVFGITIYRINGFLSGTKNPTFTQKTNASQVPAAQVPAQAQVPLEPYKLNGVIDAGENSMAIINGKFLKLEGTIDDLILKKISPKEVELLNSKDNSIVDLKIK